MKIHAIITEAEQNLAKQKIDQHLSQLSNKDLVSLLPLLKESLIEGSEDMAQQKQEGKRIFGGSANFIAYDDKSKTAQRFKDTPKGLEVTNVQYKPDNDPRRGATLNTAPESTPAPEVNQIVNNLEKSEVEALADAVVNELNKRKSGEKQSPNTKSNPALLKKVLTALLAGGLLAGAYGLGTMAEPTAELEKISQLQSTIQQYEQSDLPNADAKIKELTNQIQTIQSTLDTTTKDKSDLENQLQQKQEQEKQDAEQEKQDAEQEKQDAEQEELELQKNTLGFIGGIQPGTNLQELITNGLDPNLKYDSKNRFKKGKKVKTGTRGWGYAGGTVQHIIGNVGGMDTRNIRIYGEGPGPYGAKEAFTGISFDKEDNADAQIFVVSSKDFPDDWKEDTSWTTQPDNYSFGPLQLNKGQLERMTKRIIVNAPKELGSPVGDPNFVSGQQRSNMNLGLSTGSMVKDNLGLGLSTSLFNPTSSEYSVTQDFQHGRIIIDGIAMSTLTTKSLQYSIYDVGVIIKLPDPDAINFEESAALNDIKLLAGLN